MASQAHGRSVGVVGLGYVGLPVAVAFGNLAKTVGFDIDEARVAELQGGYDRTGETDAAALVATDVIYSTDADALLDADFIIVTVPTPIDNAKNPDLTPLEHASKTIGPRLRRGDIVVYESTVYPGATEEQCVPWLEQASGLVCGVDFFVGYSPERINPGDSVHTLEKITKVVSGQTPAVLDVVASVYGAIVTAGIHRAPSIKVAEAAKVIENTQRDLNIALMNELALIFERLDIDTADVLAAAGTKWNFLPFTPGLVGGHCIGVDPYYLTHKAALLGYHPQVILAGRRINDGMGAFIAFQTIKRIARLDTPLHDVVVTVLGLTFKENVPDLRNTRVTDVVQELVDFGVTVQLVDPVAPADGVEREFGRPPCQPDEVRPAQCVVLAVPHREFTEGGWDLVSSYLHDGNAVVIDVKGALPSEYAPATVDIWRL